MRGLFNVFQKDRVACQASRDVRVRNQPCVSGLQQACYAYALPCSLRVPAKPRSHSSVPSRIQVSTVRRKLGVLSLMMPKPLSCAARHDIAASGGTELSPCWRSKRNCHGLARPDGPWTCRHRAFNATHATRLRPVPWPSSCSGSSGFLDPVDQSSAATGDLVRT